MLDTRTMKPDQPPDNSLDRIYRKREGLPVITYTQFREIFNTDTGKDTFVDFVGFIDNQDGEPPEFVSAYINHSEYQELGSKLKNFLIMLRSGNSEGKTIRKPDELNNYHLRFMPNREFLKVIGTTNEQLAPVPREEEASGEIALRKMEMEKTASQRLGDMVARLLVVFRFGNGLTDQEKNKIRELLKILTEQFLREVVDGCIQDPEKLVEFAETFFKNDAILAELKNAKIQKVSYSKESKTL